MSKLLLDTLKLIGKGGLYLASRKAAKSYEGAHLENREDQSSYLNSRNKGLLLDGDRLHLSETESLQNVCVTARIGAGKTSRYIIPNVLDKARSKCSIVVNDPKGEVFEATSAHMKKCGYDIIVIDPENIDRSHFFNPFLEAENSIEIEQLAEILVRSGLSSREGKGDFWIQGAVRFVSLFIKCLLNFSRGNPDYYNLYNLYYLFQNFGEKGEGLDSFMNIATYNPNDSEDKILWNEWNGVLTGNKEGVKSFVLSAITSLKSLSNQNLAKLTSTSDFKLESIRNKKTIIYMITPAQHAEYFGFLTSMFFRSVFNACMRKMPDRKTLPVYILYDEFGHSTIPNFVSTINTIRGYRVSISIILQSISQLNARYGTDYANSIQGGFNTYLTYSGADPKTAEFFEKVIGRVRERQRNGLFEVTDQYFEYNLANANEIRTIGSEEGLIISGNRQPLLIKTTPYFQNWSFKRQARQGAAATEPPAHREQLRTVGLKWN